MRQKVRSAGSVTPAETGEGDEAALAGVVLAQAGRGAEESVPWLVSRGLALPLREWADGWRLARTRSVTELVRRWREHEPQLRALTSLPETRDRILSHGDQIGSLCLEAPIRPRQVFCTIGNYRRQVIEAAVDAGDKADAADRRVCPAAAGGIIAGYCLANDLTIRSRVARPDLPGLGSDWLQSKGMAGSLPLGPWFVPAWLVPDPSRLRLRLSVNGAVMQDDGADDMLFGIEHQLAYVSQHTWLRPGDVLCTGSPAGFGIHHGRYLRAGDLVQAWVSGLGEQRLRCVEEDPPARADQPRTPETEQAP